MTNTTEIQELPDHILNAFGTPRISYTILAIVKDMSKNREKNREKNLETLTLLNVSRSGGFTLSDSDCQDISFTTDKSETHNLLIDGNDSGISFKSFTLMMQNATLLKLFIQNIDDLDMSDKYAYSTINKLLQDMNYQSTQANMRQRVHNNASDTHSSMQHKEILESSSNEEKEDELY